MFLRAGACGLGPRCPRWPLHVYRFYEVILHNPVIDSCILFNLNRVCKIGTPIALRLTYLMPEAASSFYILLHVGKDANMISIDLTLVRRK